MKNNLSVLLEKCILCICLIFTVLTSTSHNLSAQSNHWYLPPNTLSFTANGLTSTPTGTQSGIATNAVYDESGDLLFKVTGRLISDKQGAIVGTLGAPSSTSINSESPEIGICPVPGTCAKYYVMRWGVSQNSSAVGAFIHATVDVSTNPISVSNETEIDYEESDGCGVLAIDRPYFSNPEGFRWLYILSTSGTLDRYEITDTGIDFDVNIFNATNFPGVFNNNTFISPEGELRGNCFAWGSKSDNQAWVVIFDFASGNVNQLIPISLPEETSVCGLEFNQEGTELYIAACGSSSERGIYTYTINPNGVPSSGSKLESAIAGAEYYDTQIELGPDEHLYMFSHQGNLGRVPLGGNIISPVSPTFSANTPFLSSASIFPFFTLLDQIDGEAIAAVPFAKVTQLDVNQQTLFPNNPPPIPNFFNCNPLILEAAIEDATSFQLRIENVPGTGTPNLSIETSPQLPTALSSQIDLYNISLSIPGGNNTALANQSGIYELSLIVENECLRKDERSGIFQLSATPSPATIDLQLNPSLASGSLQAPSTDITQPVLQGTGSCGFDLASSGGVVDFYRIDYIDKVSCADGSLIQNVYQSSNNIPVSNPNQLQNIAFNLVTFDPQTGFGYFNDPANNAKGSCFEFQVTIGNACGESSAFSYFFCDGNYRPTTEQNVTISDPSFSNAPHTDYLSTQIDESEEVFSSLTPNPAQDILTWSYSLDTKARAHLIIRDLSGKIVLQQHEHPQSAGFYKTSVDIRALPAGMYLYQIELGDKRYIDRFLKL